jgi:alpha-L-rhamnosidase
MKAIPLAQVLTIMKPIYTFLLLPALALCVAGLRAEVPASPATGGLSVADLRCEYRTNPMVIDAARPRLSWTLASPVRGARQSAYQILVASSALVLAADEGDWWDSGKVASDESTQIEYAGNPLASGANCFWKVRAWDASGQAGAWSATARWTMGLLKPEYWRASWIRADLGNEVSPWFRKTFMLDSAPPRVIAYVNAIGYFELYVNGRRVGAEVLAPAVSDTRVQSLYVAYDIGPYLQAGRNCIGLWCGRGWSTMATPPGQRVRFQFQIPGFSGQDPPVRVLSDESWKVAASPYTTTGSQSWGKFGGERYDANLEVADWNKPDFDDTKWANAKLAPASPDRADAQDCPPNRVGKVIPAITCTPLAEGRFELDFGTNLSGHLRLRMPALKANQRIVISYADRKYGPNEMTSKGPADVQVPGLSGPVRYQTFHQADEFISAGRDGEEFRSKFNYHGFRYAIVEGLPAAPALADAEASLVESDLETVGSFECSNDLLNRIHQLTLWTIRCLNLGGYMVDCPHRERLGYGDGQVSMESQAFNLWSPAFYQKWTTDWRLAQRGDSGDVPHTAPAWGGGGGPAWGGSLVTLTWRMYQFYGDRRILQTHYDAMRRYVDFLESRCKENVLRGYGGQWDFIGDWVPPYRGMDTKNWPARDAAELFNNCYRVYQWEILEKSALVLGMKDEVARCQAALAAMRPAIHKAFFDEAKSIYVIDEQSYQVMPLLCGVVPPERREAVFAKLRDGILNRCQGHLDTGMLGTYFLIEYLQQTGHDDLLFTIVNQSTHPGWGYMVASGATTLWEQWNGYYSHIHSCFASPGGWFYQGLAGVRPDPAAAGFKKIVIKPSIVGDLTWVKAHHDSIHGRIVSNWQRDGGKLTLAVTIPANTTATVFVPARDATAVTEFSKPAAQADGVKFLRMENGAAVYEVGGGSYQFQSTLP